MIPGQSACAAVVRVAAGAQRRYACPKCVGSWSSSSETGELFGTGPAHAPGELTAAIGGELPPPPSFNMPGFEQSPDVAALASAAREFVDARPHLLSV